MLATLAKPVSGARGPFPRDWQLPKPLLVVGESEAGVEGHAEGIPLVVLEAIPLSHPIEIGVQQTIEVTLTNTGTAQDTNVVLKCIADPKIEFVSAAGPTQGTQTGKSISWAPLPMLAVRAKAVYKLVCRAHAPGLCKVQIEALTDQHAPTPLRAVAEFDSYLAVR